MEIKPIWEPGSGIRVVSADFIGDNWVVKAEASGAAMCPGCSLQSTSRHSSYLRRMQDLPVQGTIVELQVTMTRWRCRNQLCTRQTFAGQVDQVTKPYARQTDRVEDLARLIGYAIGGRPAERLMRRLSLPQGDDRILRNLKRHVTLPSEPLRVIGIDDWSWQKGTRYGTIIVDLERRKVVDVLHDRSAKTTAAWLSRHPAVEIVSRDRCGLYAQAVRQGAVRARQVADRFHLVQNLRQAIEQQLSHDPLPAMRVRDGTASQTAAAADHDGLQDVLRHQLLARHGRRQVWQDRFDRVKQLQSAGHKLVTIMGQTGLNWRTVAKWAASDELPERRLMDPRSSNPRKYATFLAQRWGEGVKNGRRLLTEVRQQGYTGSFSHLERLLTTWRRTGSPVPVTMDDPVGAPAAIAVAPLMQPVPIVPPIAASILCMKPRGLLTKQEAAKVDRLKAASPNFAVMRQLAMRFRGILRGRNATKLDGWLDDAHRTGLYGIRRFVQILRRDIDAVRNAISEKWSNGQIEGQINRLKTLKRAMYGQAGTELLRARMLPLSC